MNILEIFYNEIIPEASTGRVECYFTFNTAFNTIIEGRKITERKTNNKRLLFPTLIIKDKTKFDQALIKYVEAALTFYDGNFYGISYKDDEKNYIKSILTLLWSDATSEDYINPVEYIRRKTNFLTDTTFTPDIKSEELETELGPLTYEIKKDQIFNETPYYIDFEINGNSLPIVRFGISNNTAYIYAIQNLTKTRDKKLNRALYKVNEGIDLTEPKDNIENPENIIGVTPSTLISATLAVSLLNSKGITKIIIPALLQTRWNAKEIMFDRKAYFMKEKGETEEDIKKTLEQNQKEHEEIQRNISDKFIRTFRRLAHHFDNIEVTSLPFIHDINMHLEIGDNVSCNNPLLENLYTSLQQSKTKK